MAGKTKKRTAVAQYPAAEDKEKAKAIADFALRPSVNAAAVIQEYGKPFGELNLAALTSEMVESIELMQGGDLKRCEAMLMAQAQALQSIFMNFSRRALNQDYQKHLEAFFSMAMKAQNQCRMTLETLAKMKNPPVVFAKQANIAQGHQQVNNGVAAPAHAENIRTEQNKLLEAHHGQRLDPGAAGAASGTDPAMATLAAIDGTAQR